MWRLPPCSAAGRQRIPPTTFFHNTNSDPTSPILLKMWKLLLCIYYYITLHCFFSYHLPAKSHKNGKNENHLLSGKRIFKHKKGLDIMLDTLICCSSIFHTTLVFNFTGKLSKLCPLFCQLYLLFKDGHLLTGDISIICN